MIIENWSTMCPLSQMARLQTGLGAVRFDLNKKEYGLHYLPGLLRVYNPQYIGDIDLETGRCSLMAETPAYQMQMKNFVKSVNSKGSQLHRAYVDALLAKSSESIEVAKRNHEDRYEKLVKIEKELWA